MGLVVNSIKSFVKYGKSIPKKVSTSYKTGYNASKKINKSELTSVFQGSKEVVKNLGPATTGLTILGCVIPIPFTGIAGFGLGKVIDKTLKYLKILK